LGGEDVNYKGEIFFNGELKSFINPSEALKAGINIVHQELNLCENLSVVQNVFLGRELRINKKTAWAEMKKRVDKYLQNLSLKISPDELVKNLNIAQKQLIEIIRSFVNNCRIIVMDEPTSALNSEEVEKLFKLLKKVKAMGITIIFVSHRLEEFFQIAERISILRNGRYINTLDIKQTNKNEIINLMTGNIVIHKSRKREITFTKEVIKVEGLTRKNRFYNVNFNLHEGEILGIAGLQGSGRYALVRALFGIIPKDSGEIYLYGNKIRINSPWKAIEYNIGFISRDRKGEGIFAKMNLVKNIIMVTSLKDLILKEKKYKDVTRTYVNNLKIKCNNILQGIVNLSGGNQQKSIVARWIAKSSKIMIMEEPTRKLQN